MNQTQHLPELLQQQQPTDLPCSNGQPTWIKVTVVTKVPEAPSAHALKTGVAQVLDFYPEEQTA